MSGNYARQAKSAQRLVARKGAPVVFTSTTPGSENIATGVFTGPTTVSVAGSAARIPGNPATYEALKLIESEAPTLMFTPTTYGQQPALNSTVVFGGITFITRDVNPIAPDGVTIAAIVVVSR